MWYKWKDTLINLGRADRIFLATDEYANATGWVITVVMPNRRIHLNFETEQARAEAWMELQTKLGHYPVIPRLYAEDEDMIMMRG